MPSPPLKPEELAEPAGLPVALALIAARPC
jgi:hypothetical protein